MGNFWQAWHVLSNLQISSKHYTTPGKAFVVKNVSAEFCHDVGRTTAVSSSGTNKSSVCMQTHQYISESNARSEAATCLGNGFLSSNSTVADAGKSLWGQSQVTASVVNHSHSQVSGGSFSNNSVHTSQAKECSNNLVNDMDDDDDDGILEVIRNPYNCFTSLLII